MECSYSCGHCLFENDCNHVNGSCQKGCSPGFVGERCIKSMYNYTYLRIHVILCLDSLNGSFEVTIIITASANLKPHHPRLFRCIQSYILLKKNMYLDYKNSFYFMTSDQIFEKVLYR